LGSFNAVSLTFFASYLPATVFIFLSMRHAPSRIKKIFHEDWRTMFLACALGAFSNLALNAALSLSDATNVVVINEAFLVLVLVGEHIFLKEREYTWVKALSVALAITGAILIEVSH
jgi:drug/metabolite transporter (DMT)-like permease